MSPHTSLLSQFTQAPTPTSRPCARCVRVWFGRHVICEFRGEDPEAERYEVAMRRRFAGLKVTNQPLGRRAA